MIKLRIFFFFLIGVCGAPVAAQVGINEDGSLPHPQAILDASSTTKGVLSPRMTTAQRDAIENPPEGLRIYNLDTHCENFFNGFAWFELCGVCTPPIPGAPVISIGEFVPCAGATGLIYEVADLPGVTYSWEFPAGWLQTAGGNSHSVVMTAGTTSGTVTVTGTNLCGTGPGSSEWLDTQNIPGIPIAGTNYPSSDQIVWNWTYPSGANGFRYSNDNDYATSEDAGGSTSYFQTGLTCGNVSHTLYVWAYNDCFVSDPLIMVQHTAACPTFTCGDNFTMTHIAGSTAPVTKTVTYGTVNFQSRCWITQNLGADQQAASTYDPTESSGGWFWQFNRRQGYKHDGVTRTPSVAWPTNSSSTHWTTANDPCGILLGTGWRIPTQVEYESALATWANNISAAYAGPLKMHASGDLDPSTGNLDNRGSSGFYWTATRQGGTTAIDVRLFDAFNGTFGGVFRWEKPSVAHGIELFQQSVGPI